MSDAAGIRLSRAVEIYRRYDEDPRFRAAVDTDKSGWTDEDGVHHDGPTVAWAMKVEAVIEAWEEAQ